MAPGALTMKPIHKNTIHLMLYKMLGVTIITLNQTTLNQGKFQNE